LRKLSLLPNRQLIHWC